VNPIASTLIFALEILYAVCTARCHSLPAALIESE
jgi:hypothetical protein